jgi:hypothetical protein
LPDGLHFTPAMSARVLLEDKLKLIELPMAYAERVGRSKLSVVRDGLRFLSVIVQAAVAYRPARPLLLAAGLFALTALVVGWQPLAFYLQQGSLEEFMVYRILLAPLLATASSILICSAVVADRIAARAHDRPAAATGVTGTLSKLFTRRARRIGGVALLGAAVATVWPGLLEYVGTGEVTMHWSRAVLASLLVVLAVVLGAATFLLSGSTPHVPGSRAAAALLIDTWRRRRPAVFQDILRWRRCSQSR